MRLIDADELLLKLNEAYKKANAEYHRRALNGFWCGICSALQEVIREVKEQPTTFDVQTKEIKWISVEDRLPDDGDSRFYMCLVENHLEDPPMSCQYEEERGFGFWNDIYDPVTLGFVDSEFQTMEELHYENVLYWMPLIEPPKDEEEEDKRYETD